MPRSNADALHESRTILLATDKQHSVIARLAGSKLEAIAYTVYGQSNVEAGLGFNGELCEARLGWYLLGNGYQAYNPTLMRFHSPDSWSPFGSGGLNAYMYCVDPLNFSDPTGHAPQLSSKIGKLLLNGFNFFFGGAEYSGASRTKALKATAGVEAVAGPMRPEEENILKAFKTLGAVVAGAPGAREHPDSLPGELPGTIRDYPGYEGGAARDGLTALGDRLTTGKTTPSPNLPTGSAPPRQNGTAETSWQSPRGVHFPPDQTFGRLRGGGDASGTHPRNFLDSPEAARAREHARVLNQIRIGRNDLGNSLLRHRALQRSNGQNPGLRLGVNGRRGNALLAFIRGNRW